MWFVNRVQSLIEDARKWATGRIWTWRVGVISYIVWAGYCHMSDPTAGDLFSGLTLGVHELGHLVTCWASETVTVAAGSTAQVLVPLAVLIHFMRHRDYFSVTVAGSWLSFSLFNLATYIGDARAQLLPPLALDSPPIHDWNYLLMTWGLLQQDTQIAQIVGFAAVVILVASVVWGGWLCSMMMLNRGPAKEHMVRL